MNTLSATRNLLLLVAPVAMALVAAPVTAKTHHADKATKHVVITVDNDDVKEHSSESNTFIFAGDHGFMGIEMDDLNAQLGDYFGVKDGQGVLIKAVREDSPAASAGLKAGDVIVSLDNRPVDSTHTLQRAMTGTEPDQEITVKYLRKGKKKHTAVTLAELPHGHPFSGQGQFEDEDEDEEMTWMPQMAHHFNRCRPFPHPEHQGLAEVRADLEELRHELEELRENLDKD